MKKKKSKLSLVALILDVIAIAIEIGVAGGIMGSAKTDAESFGTTI